MPVLGPIAGGMLGACIYRAAYKETFDALSVVAILLTAATLILGVVLNKIDKKDIGTIY